MKKILYLLSILFLLNTCHMFSQNKNLIKKTENLIEKGRDSIIESALKMKGDNIDIRNYLIRVKANKTSVIVNFHAPIVFLPENSVYYNNFGCDLIEGSSWAGIISNPKDYGSDQDEIPYYSPSEDTQKHIQFIFNAVNESDKIGSVSIDDFSIDDSMIIRERKEYYDILVLSLYQESFYKIDKKTGKVYDEGHAHLIPDPYSENEDDPYIEIK